MSERRPRAVPRAGASSGSFDGGDGNDLNSRVASIEKHLDFVATREDVKDVLLEMKNVQLEIKDVRLEIDRMKNWFLRCVIIAGVVAIGWIINLLRPFLTMLLSNGGG